MTPLDHVFNLALTQAGADLDAAVVRLRARFDQSLIDKGAPAEQLDVLRQYEDNALRAWRTEIFEDFCRRLLQRNGPTQQVN